MKLGLIGKSLVHSFSPDYFSEKFLQEQLYDYTYQALEIETLNKVALHQLIKKHQLNGFNVTIPYKETIVPFLDSCSNDAEEIGAINTVKVIHWPDGNLYLSGYNTDWIGFLKSIRPFLTTHHQKALILGTGGASKAVAYALKTLGIDCLLVSSKADKISHDTITYSQLNDFLIGHYKLIINTTALGTFPNNEEAPIIPYAAIGSDHLLYDLVYNPAETLFMKKGAAHGASVMNGLSMLKFQAEEAFELWKK
jgi:shikimate dehydrogenase